MNFHRFIQDAEGWELLSSDEKFANPFLEVYELKARTPSRPEGTRWTLAHRKGAAVIAPVTAEGHFLLVRQERVPIRATIWEFPAGQIDDRQEHDELLIREAAQRELREETGYELAPGGEMLSLGLFFPSPGFTDEHSHLFLARPVVPSARGMELDENEQITEVRAMPPAEFRDRIAAGEIRDANTLSAYARLCARGLFPA